MLENLKVQVLQANLLLPKYHLVTFTWGNVSGIDRASKLIAIKPSGVSYEDLRVEDIVLVDFSGNVVEGCLRPSSDTLTHLELYSAFPAIGGVVHTHSPWATSWAQAGRAIPCYGTTHADYFYGDVPCVRSLSDDEINDGYEMHTGLAIVDTVRERSLDPLALPAVLCRNHGTFAWGVSPHDAVHAAVVLEEVAKMALHTEQLNPKVSPAEKTLQDKHYFRKHGAAAYYGQGI